MRELKVGDRVKVIDNRENLSLKSNIGELKINDETCKPYKIYFKDIDKNFWFYKDQVVSGERMTKKELLDMPIGTKITTDAKEDNEFVYDGDSFYNENGCIEDYDIEDDLSISDEDYGTKIIKIEEPKYTTIYDYSTEVQEMTVAEIEKALGHAVKIIKEEE